MNKMLAVIFFVAVSCTAWAESESLSLAKKSGCLACHQINKKIVGPAWLDVANRYRGDKQAKTKLMEKLKKGGKGNWTKVTGGASMPPFAHLGEEKIETLVNFVLSLSPQQ